MKTRFLPALAVACSAVVMHAAEPAKPNVLLIIADDLTKAWPTPASKNAKHGSTNCWRGVVVA